MRVLLLLLVAGCAPQGSRVRLDLRYDAAWALDGVQVTMTQHREADARMAHELLLLVPDTWAGGSIGIDLWGVHGGERRAWGHADVTPIKSGEVKKEVVLTRLPCGAWCTPGAVECAGHGTVVCIQDADGCSDWGPPTMCPSSSPFCAFGACAATCRDECAAGESRCDGTTGSRSCGHISDDTCLHWLLPVACASGLVCSNGACAATCSDECAAGQVSCLAGGTIRCGDANHDGCLEWSPIVPCAAGSTCSAGQCSTTCTDDCAASACSGLVYRACGKFGPDNCNHLSAGVSCVPADSCMAGRCGESGCESAPLVCEAPPASTCADTNTLRVYDPNGTCSTGTCSYTSHDMTCSNCPACDPSPSPSCTPACSGKSCGADDGCGGKCNSGCWTAAANLSTPRMAMAAATALDGRIYAMGGVATSTGANLALVEEYTPAPPGTLGSWRTVAPLPQARAFIGATTAADGRIYVAGGDDTAVFIYTPGAPGTPGSWASAPSLMTSRVGPGVATGSDGRIYVVGGWIGADSLWSGEALTPGDSAWQAVPDMIESRAYGCAATVGDGHIYSIAGLTNDSNGPAEAYSIATGAWASIAETGSGRSSFGCATSSTDGRIYVIGGDSEDSSGHISRLVKVQAYTPSTNLWARVTSLANARDNVAAAAGLDGRIYAIGGTSDGKQALSSVEYYTP